MQKKVILRQIREPDDFRYLGAELKDNGDLFIEGQDLGKTVEEFFGTREYEFCWTVKAENIPLFIKKIGGDGSILDLLKRNFSDEKAAGLYSFMQDNEIPFESWSRTGD